MAKYTLTFNANAADQKVMTVKIPGTATEWFANSYVYGTFGGGTVTLFASPDGGTTKIALKDAISGTAISVATTAAMNTIRLGSGSKLDDNIGIYATLSGATNPSLTVAIFDNLA